MLRRAGAAREDGVRSCRFRLGTVTLLFSDIEGSTRLLERLGQRYDGLLDEHRRIVRGAIAAHGGCEVRTEGDAFFVAFARAGDAVGRRLRRSEGWRGSNGHRGWRCESGSDVHTGEPRVMGDDYVGIDVHRAARICSAAHGGQVVISEATGRLLAGRPVDGVALRIWASID